MIAFSKNFPSFDKVFKYNKVLNPNGLNSINWFNGKKAIIKDTFLGDLRKTFFIFSILFKAKWLTSKPRFDTPKYKS